MSHINLLPDDYVARRAQKRANRLCVILFSLVMAGVVTAALISAQTHRRTLQVNERVTHSYHEASKLIQQLQELESTRQRMVQKATMTARLLERVPRSYLLAMVTNALPRSSSLLEFELDSRRDRTTVVTSESETSKFHRAAAKRKRVEEAVKLEVTVTVTGLAATDVDVARFMAEMKRCPLLERVELVYSEEKKVQDAVVRQFQVEMKLKPGADVRDVVSDGSVAVTRPPVESEGQLR